MRTWNVVLPAIALSMAGVCQAEDWLPAIGTGTCSVTDLDFSGPRDGFAAGAFNCGLITSDGGVSWQPIDVMPQQGQSLVFAHAATRDSLYAARGGLYHSDDRGLTWREVGVLGTAAGSIFDVHFATAERWIAIKGGQILLTTNAGEDWTLVHEGNFNANMDELHFPKAQVGFATGGVFREFGEFGTVLRSDDGGSSWTPLDFSHGMITAAHFTDVNHGVVATLNQGMFETTDGAANWDRIGDTPGGPGLSDLRHRGARWYASSNSGCLYESIDSARTWQLALCDPSSRSFSALSVRGSAVVAGGNSGSVVHENRVFRSGFQTD
jgi:photosystem II stability/assembly factor-like uncharacterized protein